MNGDHCTQKGCTGFIEDGYCNVCGLAGPRSRTASVLTAAGTAPTASVAVAQRISAKTNGSAVTATGSSPVSRAAKGSRRTTHASSRSTRKQLGAGLITLPDLPSTDPEKAVLENAIVPERKRFCPKCDAPLRREAGFCGKCGQKYSFLPTLTRGDVVGGQYEVKGVLAFGGLGWIYLAFDTVLTRYVVLKGLLNTHDSASAAAALAERQFLAAVKHPNIVGIYNFVQQGSEGFIVMEYIGGKTLKQIRQERGPLPVPESIAYIHRILSAFTYLHERRMVYCDFKPDNVMLERDDVKLIDMGGVRCMNDLQGDIYGTVGYSAPEAVSGPTVASDLFTVGRTLAVLLTEIRSFSSEHRFTLPSPEEETLFAQQESLYRTLLKATANNPDDRFESAEEMAEQLLGVLREVVSIQTSEPKPAVSSLFGPDGLAFEPGHEREPIFATHEHLPMPLAEKADPGTEFLAVADRANTPDRRIAVFRAAVKMAPASRLLRLRLSSALADSGAHTEAGQVLDALEQEDAWDWKVLWFRARLRISQKKFKDAQALFDQVYFDLPGELAPKLALAVAAELAGEPPLAIKMYNLVSKTDPGFVSACFGLARCLMAKGDRRGAVEALNRIQPSSALYVRARIEVVRAWIGGGNGPLPGADELTAASAIAEALNLDGFEQLRLASQILATALDMVASRRIKSNPSARILGEPLVERRLRSRLEKTYRALAQFVSGDDRIRLVDRANEVRPRTLV